MNSKDREALLRHRMVLIQDLEPSDILSYMYQERVLSENDTERIRAQSTRRARVELLLDTLPRKGKMAYSKFAIILSKTAGYGHLYEKLMEDRVQGDEVDLGGMETHKTSAAEEKETISVRDTSFTYPMHHVPRGWCLIINNINFSGSLLPKRVGADVDGKNIYELFRALKFKMWYLQDATAELIRQSLNDLSTYDHNEMDCLVVILMSHGMQGTLYSIDNVQLDISTLISPLIRQDIGNGLCEKPKLFFIQACRITEHELSRHSNVQAETQTEDHVWSQSQTVPLRQNDVDAVQEKDIGKTEALLQDSSRPLEADVLLAYSTFPATVALRNIDEGSWFIKAIVDVFTEHSKDEDVVTMLLRVNNYVASRVSSQGLRQVPAPVISLRKRLFLASQIDITTVIAKSRSTPDDFSNG